MEKQLHVIRPDEHPKYKYSDGLFDWFYSKVKYFGFSSETWEECVIIIEQTKRDNKSNGIRIWLQDGTYIKLDEVLLLMEFTGKEWNAIENLSKCDTITIQDVVTYYYQT